MGVAFRNLKIKFQIKKIRECHEREEVEEVKFKLS